MTTEKRGSMFLFGGLGGIMPTCAALASTLVTVPKTPLPETPYLVGLAIYFGIGGCVALMNATTEFKHAMYAGIAAPAILTSIIAGAGDIKTTKADAGWFLSSAFAQEAPIVQPFSPDSNLVIVSPNVVGQNPSNVDIQVYAKAPAGAPDLDVLVGEIKTLEGQSVFSVPKDTKQVMIGGKVIDTDQDINRVDLRVESGPSKFSDFWWALGSQRTYVIKNIDVFEKQ